MPSKIWKEQISVSSFDVGASGRLEAAALMRHFQEVAAHHADELGVGFSDLMKEKVFWALTHLQIEADRWPGMEEQITVETWPRGTQKLYTTRDFLVSDGSGKVIIRATSAWIMVDYLRKRPVRPAERLANIDFTPGKEAISSFPEPFTCEGDQQSEAERKVAYSDLDINQHVNNTRYVEWIMDAIGFLSERWLKSLNIHFSNEFKYNETAILKWSTNGDDFYCSITHQKTEKTGVEACLKFTD
ncbi:acyl-ACP thioesterase [Marinilabilia salmonicolor]|jgi:acyl-ACP thioesterase|uniref:acyl-[acyl-carrier-protein] thioesterase n=1 Tax=Marinilabilia salmonicolor TaxID=989 RepID=UPI000D06CF48|nr:acyl-ACP thioesterase domain-containing protein [Marinilabilia salmonicolor]PRZ02137.1 acyl-ACP thioesterase [Marinilabilia salmonicolor]